MPQGLGSPSWLASGPRFVCGWCEGLPGSGVRVSRGGGDMGQELPGKVAAVSKEQGDLWASLCTHTVSTVPIHFAE